MFCEKCGSKLKGKAKYCDNCGTKIDYDTLPEERISINLKQGIIVIVVIVVLIFIISCTIVLNKNSMNAVKEAGYIETTVEETEAEKEARRRELEEQSTIRMTISSFASEIKSYNYGAVKYVNFEKYKETQKGDVVYKIKYETSYDGLYYYQLVSLDGKNEKVTKKTRLFSFFESNNSIISGETLEMEYAYEETWD